jgi:isocitrate dehydrogenase kinase/phosphatase
MNEPTSASRAADTIHRCFDEYLNLFREITRRARKRFERADWDGIRRDTVRRLDLYERMIGDALGAMEEQLKTELSNRELWMAIKSAYWREVLGRDDFELAQTFFNSLTRRVFPHDGVDPSIDFTAAEFPLPFRGWEMASARMYAINRLESEIVGRIIEDAAFQTPFEDLRRDSELAAARLERRVRETFGAPEFEALDMLRPVLVRNKAAYLVGRVRSGERLMPVVLAILNRDGRLVVDAVLATEEEVSILFSFARWYFHADLGSPREMIGFLLSILPRKTVAELYISLGYHKHGKTELHRDLLRHVAASEELFTVAPGVPGLVMEVFTLPSYEFVFKVIKDFFPPEKPTTHDEIKARYREVMRHDRVGRLVDFQTFGHIKMPRSRFEPSLLRQLLESSSKTVSVEGEDVVIRHMYVGRRVTPLDIFLREHARSQAAHCAIVDWGSTLRELAAANIFAGDLLLKNFGVTRHGRVVFYDYDELCPVTDCCFRKIPPARSIEDEMASEPWFSVGPNDIFPEELLTFVGLDGSLRGSLDEYHADLFTADFWNAIQQRHVAGELLDFFPYAPASRLHAEPESEVVIRG